MGPRVQIKKLRPDAVVPRYMSAGAAGLDLCASVAAPLVLAPGARMLVGTGLAIALPQGYEGQVRPRSGLALGHGISLVNSPGTIDEDYRGEIGLIVINHGAEPFRIAPGDRLAQLVIAPVTQAELVEVAQLGETDRGSGGFGSTGR